LIGLRGPHRGSRLVGIALNIRAYTLILPKGGTKLHIVVCVKQVPDWDIPPASFKVDEAAKKVVPPQGVAAVTSQFDQIAVEAAMRIKDADPGAKVTVMSMGAATAREVIKQGLAMGADEGLLLIDDAFNSLDSNAVATVLSSAIKKIGDVDLVLTGRQAVDWDFGITGTLIAGMIDAPVITFAKSVAVSGGAVTVERVLPDAFETVEAPLPAVVTISNELGEPRYPKLQQIMAAGKKPVTNWGAGDIGVDAAALALRLTLESLLVPVVDTNVELMEGDTPEEQAQALARRLQEAKLI
jgi:electron transfer flavoprotein beta subunit